MLRSLEAEWSLVYSVPGVVALTSVSVTIGIGKHCVDKDLKAIAVRAVGTTRVGPRAQVGPFGQVREQIVAPGPQYLNEFRSALWRWLLAFEESIMP